MISMELRQKKNAYDTLHFIRSCYVMIIRYMPQAELPNAAGHCKGRVGIVDVKDLCTISELDHSELYLPLRLFCCF